MALPPRRHPLGLALRGRRIVCWGMGESGIAAALFLKAHGGDPLVVDEGPAEQLGETLRRLQEAGIRAKAGIEGYEALEDPELIVVSPGVPTAHPLLEKARAAGVKIIGEIELAYCFASAPIVAVTGTNGKGTTTRMLAEMLRAGGLRVRAGGNIGEALIRFVEEEADVLVAEVSSFQLETIEHFRPWAAVLLNITPDHLNRYASFGEYVAAKVRLFMNQQPGDIGVLNMDDPVVAQQAAQLRRPYLSVRLTDPQAHGFVEAGQLYVRLLEEKEAVCVGRWDDLFIPAPHYATDALCAALVARAAGVSAEAIRRALRAWRPVKHQLEEIAVINGVRFLDDSKATNPAAAAADMRMCSRPLIVIGGGETKGLDMRAYADALAECAEVAFLIGQGAEEIAAAVGGRIPVTISGTLEKAVPAAWAVARPGTTIILAPGCASFDQFRGQAERGERFAALVRQLAEACRQKGEAM